MFSVLVTFALAADPAAGHLVAVGGGTTTDVIGRRTLEIAGGANARVLVVPQASAGSTGEGSVAMWRECGAKTITVLDLKDPAAVKAVESADLIWMPGGDQNRLMEALKPTGVPAAIRDRYKRGATVGGTSAGAAVISAVCLTGDADLDRIRFGTTGIREGLGLWPDVIVDQHFVRRERFRRLMAATLDRPQLLGVGIDENTAAVVTGPKFEVIGAGQVLVIDARKAKASPGKKGDLIAAEGVTLHVLTPGMTFTVK
jgi:cyanophycinase